MIGRGSAWALVLALAALCGCRVNVPQRLQFASEWDAAVAVDATLDAGEVSVEDAPDMQADVPVDAGGEVAEDAGPDVDAGPDLAPPACKADGCADDNPCTDDSCDVVKGCLHLANSATCTDGDACTVGDGCGGGVCLAGAASVCDDGNPCTDDSCATATGCVTVANAATCTDDDACTTGDVCKDGGCATTGGLACEDGNPCTDDACAKDKGCVTAANAATCTDGDACTVGDGCKNGGCLAVAIDAATACDDGNVCTVDACEPKTGCTHTNSIAACDDGNPCTSNDHCKGGQCADYVNCCGCASDKDCGGPPGGNLCNGKMYCDKPAKACSNACKVDVATIVTCDTSGDGACQVTACEPATGKCVASKKVEGLPCDADGSVCTEGDACAGGKCAAGKAQACDDGNPCTDQSCDKIKGCVLTQNNASCSDGNSCTNGDLCKAGSCQPGTPALGVTTAPDSSGAFALVPMGEGWFAAAPGAGLYRFDAVGQIVWKAVAENPMDVAVDGAIAYAAGTVNKVAWAGAWDWAGNKLWQIDPKWSGNSFLNSIAVAKDGTLWAGGAQDWGTDSATAMLLHLASDGTLLASKKLPFSGTIRGLRLLGDDSIFVSLDTVGGGNWTARVAHLDAQGNVLSAQAPIPSAPSWLRGRIAILKDDTFVVAGFSKSSPSLGWMVWVDASGKVLHTAATTFVGDSALMTALELPDGSVLGAGFGTKNPADGRHLVIRRFDGNGQEVNTAIYPDVPTAGTGMDQCSLARNSSGGLAAWIQGADGKPRLVRLTVFGQDDCGIAGGCATMAINGCDDNNSCTLDGCDAKTGCTHASAVDGAACVDGALCLVLQTCLAGKCQGGKDKLFEKSYTVGLSYTGGGQAFRLPDGGFFQVGSTGNGSDPKHVTLHTDASGNQLSMKTVGVGAISRPVPLADGTFLLHGWKDPGGQEADTHLQKVNVDGALVWETAIGGPGWDSTNAGLELSNGHILLVGTSVTGGSGGLNGWLVRVDFAGKLLSQSVFGGDGDDEFSAITPVVGGAGWFASGGTMSKGNGSYDPWLVRIDANGKQIWERVFPATGAWEEARDVLALADGGALVGAAKVVNGTVASWLIRVDASGNVVWDRLLGPGPLEHLASLPGSGWAGVGTLAGKGAFLRRTDSAGNLVGETWYGAGSSNATDNLRGVVLLPDGGFILGGEKVGTGFWQLRTDAWGHASCGDAGTCASKGASDCDDKNPCTLDICSASLGCSHVNLMDGAACTDVASCQVQQTCLAGKCQGGKDKLYLKSLSGGGPGTIQSVQSLSDGGAIISGGHSNTQCFAKRVDAAGELIWDTSFTCDASSTVPAALIGGQSYLWQVSGAQPVASSSGEVRNINMADGSILWKHTVGGVHGCGAIAAHPAGGAVIGCTGGVTAWTDGTASEVSKTTAKWWSVNVGGEFVRAVHVLPNGHVTVGGRLSGAGYVQRLDATGVQLWVTSVAQCNQVDSVSVLADGSIIAFGQVGPGGDGWFFKLGANGQLLTSKKYSGCGVYGCFHDLVELGGGQLAVVGGHGGQATLNWMTTDGSILATKKWLLGSNAIFWDIEPVGNSGFLLGGEYIQSLLRVDAFGNDSCAVAGGCALKPLADCDDKNPCTLDGCDGKTGCTHSNLADASPCGTSGTCASGKCTANAVECTQNGDSCGAGKGTCTSGHCYWTDAKGYKWTLVPAGTFWMGCNAAVDNSCKSNESPQHLVELSAYWLGVYEVTVANYKSCVDGAGAGCSTPGTFSYATWGVAGKEQHPVNYLSWAQSQSYCKWLGGDLPTEAQWEKAAKGGCEVYAGKDCKTTEPKYPWGNSAPVCGQQAVFDDSGTGKTCGGAFTTYAVGAGSAAGQSPYGAYDMAGNVWEWSLDWYDSAFYGKAAATQKDAVNSTSASLRVLRGGSIVDGTAIVRAGFRLTGDPGNGSSLNYGARCVRSDP